MSWDKKTTKESGSGNDNLSGSNWTRHITTETYDNGSKHTTESFTNDNGSWRTSWDTDKGGNVSDMHISKND